MFETFVEDTKNILVKPQDAFKKLKEKSLSSVFQNYFTLLIMYTILVGIVAVSMGIVTFNHMISQAAALPVFGSLLSGGLADFSAFVISWQVFSVFVVFLFLLFGIFLKGLVLHVFVLLVGGEKDVVQTIKTTMYAATPYLVLGWIPIISIIGLVWSLILVILGLEETQELSLGKAALVVLIPIVLGLILVGLGAVVIVTFLSAFFGLFH